MTYIIGEIGQNHNGNVEIAKQIIDVVSQPVIDKLFNIELPIMNAVKLTKRDLKYELSDSQMKRPYLNKNSFAPTYGEHREFLELDDSQHYEIYKYAKTKNLDFVETLCATSCLSILNYFTPDKLKVASRDLTNLPLLEALAETKIPIIISTGMAGKKELDQAIRVISKHHNDLSILHCVSQYPTEPKNVNLNTIPYLIENYPNYTIGYSDHTIGMLSPILAVALGAKVIEKHFTLNNNFSDFRDHKISLNPDDMKKMIFQIRRATNLLGSYDKEVGEKEKKLIISARRTLFAKNKIDKNQILSEQNLLYLRSLNKNKTDLRKLYISKKAKRSYKKGEQIE